MKIIKTHVLEHIYMRMEVEPPKKAVPPQDEGLEEADLGEMTQTAAAVAIDQGTASEEEVLSSEESNSEVDRQPSSTFIK